jgi:glycosyltransferase involved in cell wall biosynthesis
VAWHRKSRLRAAGLDNAKRLPFPRRPLHEAWSRTGRPRPGIDADLIHAPSLAFPSRGRRPLVVTVHDVLFLEFPEAYTAHGLAFHRRALGRLWEADLVICPSRAAAHALRSVNRVPPDRIRVVPLGTDLVRPVHPDGVLRELGIDGRYVVWMGTIEPRKNLGRAISAFLRATNDDRSGDRPTLLLVGPSGWLDRPIRDLLERPEVRKRVRRLGRLDRERQAAVYARAEALLLPSLGEGFGLPVLEAMACGTPVVTSDRSSLPEVAGDAAVLCDPLDEESIAAALSSVLTDPKLAERLRQRGLARAAGFTWERTARETAACYREVLAGAR